MRTAHAIPGVGSVREISIVKAIFLTIITLGIYYAVLVFGTSKDLQAVRSKPHDLWMVWFWLGFITFGLTWIVLYVVNGQALAEIRARTGQAESSLWIVSLVLAILLSPIGQFIWAVHHNDTVRAGASGSRPPPMPAQQTA